MANFVVTRLKEHLACTAGCWKCLPFTMWRSRNSIDEMALPVFLHLKRLRVGWRHNTDG